MELFLELTLEGQAPKFRQVSTRFPEDNSDNCHTSYILIYLTVVTKKEPATQEMLKSSRKCAWRVVGRWPWCFFLFLRLFPTCQVSVVRLYYIRAAWPAASSSSSASSSSAVCCNGQPRISTASCRSQWAAGPQPGSQDYNGQRRTSTGELASGVGSAGPHPGSSRAEWAAPDLTSQKKEVRRYVRKCQKECQKKCQKKCQKRMSEDMSEKDVRKYVRQECQRICQKECQ